MKYILLILTIALFISCSQEDNFSEKRNNIIGVWEVDAFAQGFKNDKLEYAIHVPYGLTFNSDGTGFEDTNEDHDFNWKYQLKPEKIFYEFVDVGGDNFEYDIIVNEPAKQIWVRKFHVSNDGKDYSIHTFTMTKN